MNHGRQRYSDKGIKTRTRNPAGFIQARSLPKTKQDPARTRVTSRRRGAAGREDPEGTRWRVVPSGSTARHLRSGGRTGELAGDTALQGRIGPQGGPEGPRVGPRPVSPRARGGRPGLDRGAEPQLRADLRHAERQLPRGLHRSTAPTALDDEGRADAAPSRKARRALERLLNTQSVYAQVDENGRIVLPQRLREMFGLDEEALFAGMGEHFQIWAPEAYAAGHGEHRRLARRARRRRGSLRGARRDGPRGPVMMMAPRRPARPGAARADPARGGAGARRLARRHLRGRRLCPRRCSTPGPARVIGDRPRPRGAARGAAAWARRLRRPADARATGRFGALDRIAAEAGAPALDGVVLDIGVSSMQLDQAGARLLLPEGRPARHADEPGGPDRGRSRQPAARGARSPTSSSSYGEERASRRIARAIVADRAASAVRDDAAARRR